MRILIVMLLLVVLSLGCIQNDSSAKSDCMETPEARVGDNVNPDSPPAPSESPTTTTTLPVQVDKGAGWDRTCQNGKCTLSLYSGVRNVFEDGKWKRVEEARSLKDVWKKTYLEKDPDFDIEILHVNYTDIELNFSFNASNWEQYPECADSKVNDIKCDFKPTVEEAKSLKGRGFDIVYLENDSAFRLIVDDFNLSFIDFSLNFTGNASDYPEFCSVKPGDIKCDFKIGIKETICNATECWKKETKFQYKYQDKNGVVKQDLKFNWKGNPLGKEFSFGGNSTTITLTAPDTENMDDAFGRDPYGAYNYGADTNLRIVDASTSGYDYNVQLKWNITSPGIIPTGQTIDNAQLCLYLSTTGVDSGDAFNVSSYHVYNYPAYNISDLEWCEGPWSLADYPSNTASGCQFCHDETPTSSSQMNLTETDTLTFTDSTSTGVYYCWDVTPATKSDYDSLNSDVTILLNPSGIISGSLIAVDFLGFVSKEGASNKPYFNITYSSAADSTEPTISAEAINDTEIYVNGTVKLNCTVSDDTAVDIVKFYIEPFGNLTATDADPEFYIICDKDNPCNTTVEGQYNWTWIWANDTTNNINSTIVTLNYTVVTTTTTTTTTIPVVVSNQHQKIIRTEDNAISGIILSGLLLIGGLKCGKRFYS